MLPVIACAEQAVDFKSPEPLKFKTLKFVDNYKTILKFKWLLAFRLCKNLFENLS